MTDRAPKRTGRGIPRRVERSTGLKGSKASPGPRGKEPYAPERDATRRQMGSMSPARARRMMNNERGASNGNSRPGKASGYGGLSGSARKKR